jgi:hypothetical protein
VLGVSMPQYRTAFPQRRRGPDRHPISPRDPLVVGTASYPRLPRHEEIAQGPRLFVVEILATLGCCSLLHLEHKDFFTSGSEKTWWV